MTDEQIHVEVAYAREHAQALLTVKGPSGLSVAEAVERSGILDRFPEIDLKVNKLGIFGKLVRLEHVLQSGDRVEIYTPLIADPKQARKERAGGAAKSGRAKESAEAGST
ncbi:MAG TPA: RnfH family protein [Chromatiaceae bacterium]|nr:MAG: hypothetical protein N838_22245 [Thiohalocapsa sp. PB-PSB1]QQO52690.1 MAG: RnfH family protein [Thiohalocapsa sp. PB-PSB1]HBG95913.1 RnfH family protein [Chromatiaceae bacterium]HCS89521.1 RnfH family protein [Chromatiaceae bacterium]